MLPTTFPQLETERLILRIPEPSDADAFQAICQDEDMARGTGVIPFPYPEGAATDWINRELTSLPKGDGSAYVLTLKDTGQVMGNISVHESEGERKAVIGYIVGRQFKGCGYAGEALQRVIQWYFESTAHLRLFATCFSFNAASARILEKSGFQREGIMRQDYCPDGRIEDVFIFGLLRSEWEANQLESTT